VSVLASEQTVDEPPAWHQDEPAKPAERHTHRRPPEPVPGGPMIRRVIPVVTGLAVVGLVWRRLRRR
jgi:hypothetical protein